MSSAALKTNEIKGYEYCIPELKKALIKDAQRSEFVGMKMVSSLGIGGDKEFIEHMNDESVVIFSRRAVFRELLTKEGDFPKDFAKAKKALDKVAPPTLIKLLNVIDKGYEESEKILINRKLILLQNLIKEVDLTEKGEAILNSHEPLLKKIESIKPIAEERDQLFRS